MANTNDTELMTILSEINWLPPEGHNTKDNEQSSQLKKIINNNRYAIISDFSDETRSILEATTLCTIYHEETKTWGIVSRTKHMVTFHLKNPFLTRIKKACENLVQMLQSWSYEKYLKKKTLIQSVEDDLKHTNLSKNRALKLSPYIEIFEKDSDFQILHGKIMDKNSIKVAIQERPFEFYLSVFSGIITILMLLITSPIFSYTFSFGEWGFWLNGIFERLVTACLIAFLVSFVSIFSHWRSIRMEYPIKWSDE
jgi:hypothetical protein